MHQNPGLASAQHAQTPANLARWERLMQRSRDETLAGHGDLAMFTLQQALSLAQDLLEHSTPATAHHCIAAFVVSHHNLADLYADARLPDLAAHHLCQAHLALLDLMRESAAPVALQQIAWQHSRETHTGLLLFQRRWGPHPGVTRLLNAGLIPGEAQSSPLH